MNHIAIVPYKEMDFVFVSNHYDMHLSGLCKFNNEFCRFQIVEFDINFDENPEYYIYKLTTKEKIKWLYRKTLFELCIGYHWTYPYRKNGLKPRKPDWFWQIIHNLYFHKALKRK